jgi:hypothetical protein
MVPRIFNTLTHLMILFHLMEWVYSLTDAYIWGHLLLLEMMVTDILTAK